MSLKFAEIMNPFFSVENIKKNKENIELKLRFRGCMEITTIEVEGHKSSFEKINLL